VLLATRKASKKQVGKRCASYVSVYANAPQLRGVGVLNSVVLCFCH